MTNQTDFDEVAQDETDEFDPFANIDRKNYKMPNPPKTLAEADRVFDVGRNQELLARK